MIYKEEVEKEFKTYNLTMIDTQVTTTKEKINFIDNEGYKYFLSVDCLRRSKKRQGSLLKFKPNTKYCIENIVNWIKLEKVDIALMSQEYSFSKEKLLWKCLNCGDCFYRTVENVIKMKRCKCEKCSILFQNHHTHKKEYIEDFLKNKGYSLLDSEYINAKEKMSLIDKAGYKYYTSFDNLKGDKTPYKFNKCNIYTIDNIKKYININNINVEILSNNYIDFNKKLTFKCSCGNVYQTSLSKFIYCEVHRCQICSKKTSKFAKAVENYLDKNNIKYIKEKTYKGLVSENNKKLRYDYYLCDFNILLEVDGKQHFLYSKNGFFTEEKFKKIKERDKIKDDFASKNKIKLIRLPYYTYNKNNDYLKILNKILPINK